MLANKRKFAKTKRVNECNDAKQARLARKRECDKSQRAIETIDKKKVRLAKKAELDRLRRAQETNDNKQLRLAKRREAYKNRMSSLNNQKESNVQENQSASTCLTTHSNVTRDIGKTVYLNEFDALKMVHYISNVGQNAAEKSFINLCNM